MNQKAQNQLFRLDYLGPHVTTNGNQNVFKGIQEFKNDIHNYNYKRKNEQEKISGEEDLAEYTCHASNSQGEAEQSIQLTGGQLK